MINVCLKENNDEFHTELLENKDNFCTEILENNEEFLQVFGEINTVTPPTPGIYKINLDENSDLWEEANGKWRVRITQAMHKLQTINSISVESQSTVDVYENIIYSYKRYASGSVSIILDKKMNIRIIIEGET